MISKIYLKNRKPLGNDYIAQYIIISYRIIYITVSEDKVGQLYYITEHNIYYIVKIFLLLIYPL